MKDRKGVEIKPNHRVLWFRNEGTPPVKATVRRIGSVAWPDHARVDDGDAENDDPFTNGFHVTAWVEGGDLEVVKGSK